MCGLYGAIGERWSVPIIRALAMANRERGTDSIGFFDSRGRICKRANDAIDALREKKVSNWLVKSADKSWFIAGHNRAATKGDIVQRNAHPFTYGKYIGSHNGIVCAPASYVVDSMYLIDLLNIFNGDYQTAFANVSGLWTLTWFDGSAFYMHSYNMPLALAYAADGTIYYSSDCNHLLACIDYTEEIYQFGRGQTVKFTLGNDGIELEILPRLAVPKQSPVPFYFM